MKTNGKHTTNGLYKKLLAYLIIYIKNGSVSTQAPAEQESYSEYISDMSRPVPYTANPTTYRTKEFMVDDQRFATSRPDVITFMTEPLCDTLTLAGPIEVELMTAISSTDADLW